MNKFATIFNFLRQCPQFQNMWSIMGGESLNLSEEDVIQLAGDSGIFTTTMQRMADGGRKYIKTPTEPYYEDYRVVCYRQLFNGVGVTPEYSENVIKISDLNDAIQWIIEQEKEGNYPDVEEMAVVSIKPQNTTPWEAQRYEEAGQTMVEYWINIRVEYANPIRNGMAVLVQ